MIEPKIRIYTPSIVKQGMIDETKVLEIEEFLKRLYNVVLNHDESTPFAMRDLVGGYSFDWTGTPLHCIYVYYLNLTQDQNLAFQKAARDAGRFLARTLEKDERVFVATHGYYHRKRLRIYQMVRK